MTSAAVGETLMPVRHGSTAARIAALLGVCVPPAAVVVLLAPGSGDALPAILLVSIAALSVMAAVAAPFASRLVLEPGQVRSRRVGDSSVIRGEEVAAAITRRVETPDELDSHRNLFLVGRSGRTLLRMSDRWWTEAQMARVVAHLAVPTQSTEEAVYLAELRRTAPEQLRWQERHGWTWVAIRTVVVSCAALGIAALANAVV